MRTLHRLILSLALIAGVAPAFAQVPPPVPALPDTERRTTYSISASTCACNVNFALYGDSTDVGNWLEVFVNGAKITQSGNWNLTSPTGSIATIPRPITDAVLTFTAAQTGTVQIVGARRPRRASQFTTQPSARDFNQVLTDIIAQNRETWDKLNDVTGRTVQAPPGETLALLPVLASRANTGACFDSSGNLTSCVAVASSTFVAGPEITFTGTNPTTIALDHSGAATNDVQSFNGTRWIHATLISVLNTACTVLPSACNSFFGYYSPQWFGAACNGTGDDGPAIQAAINVSGAQNVKLCNSHRVVTPITVTKRTNIYGAAPYITVVDFEPSVNNQSLFTLGRVGGTTGSISLSGLLAFSANTTFTKYAFNVIDIAESHLRDLSCTQTNGGGGNWTGNGGSGSSACMLHQGSFLSSYENLNFYSDAPIVFAPNPNTPTFNASDHNEFRDLQLVSDGIKPCIFVQPSNAPSFTNTTFNGRQAWVHCFPAFQWSATLNTSGLSSAALAFYNVRTEQNLIGAATYTFAISLSGGHSLQGLTIENAVMESSARGMALTGVFGATIRGSQKLCGVGAEHIIEVDTTDDQIALQNNLWGSNCTVSTGTMTAVNTVPNPNGGAAPISAMYYAVKPTSPILYQTLSTGSYTVATLPACGAATKGSRATITDSSVTFTAGIGGALGSGGANVVPVFCDGSIWRLG